MSALRFVRSILVSSALALVSLAQGGNQTSQVLLSASSGAQFASGDDLEGDLNCDEVIFPRRGLRSIVQNVPAMGPEFAASMRRRAKTLTLAAVLGSNSVLHSYYQQGILAGLEFDWFFPNGNQAPTTYRLPGIAEIFVLGAESEPRLVARVYGYDAPQYDKRRATVQMMISHPMRVYPVWAEDVLSSCGGHGSPLAITGFANAFHGRVAASDALALTGMQNLLMDGALASGETFVNPHNQVAFLLHADLAPAPSVPFAEDAVRSGARSTGTYAAGDLVIDEEHLPPAGIVFAEGSIRVDTTGAVGRYTFVSASGSVQFRGDGNAFRPFLADVLAVSFSERVVLSGEQNQFLGELHAPLGTLEVTGSDNCLLGILVGASASVTGSSNVVTDGTHSIPLP